MNYQVSIQTQITTDAGKLVSTSAIELRIKKNMRSLIDNAVLKVPITCRLEKSGVLLPSEQTSKVFKRGDRVEIMLGHDGNLMPEFKGFIKRINLTNPLEIECEGYSWQLRRKAPVKHGKKVKLREVLNLLIEGTDITIHPDTPDVDLSPFTMGVNGEDALDVLEGLVKTKAIVGYFINGNELYVGVEAMAVRTEAVKYKLGYNTLIGEDLKYKGEEDIKAHISVTYTDEKGKLKHTSIGEKGGIELRYNFNRVGSADEAKRLGLEKSKIAYYSGYEGKIKALLVPYCQPGWKGIITDPEYPQRDMSCLVEGVETVIDEQGDTRTIEVGIKLNKQR